MNEIFSRIEHLIGTNNLNKLNNSTVAVIGLGGVGATAALCLARCGIGEIVLMDFDIINKSNFNRQLIANTNTLNKYKTEVLKEQIMLINEKCNVVLLNERFDENSNLFDYKFDYLIDAIDSVDNKILLIKKCLKNNICFISSMGTAKKMDISKLCITELAKTTYDPLAKVIRTRLKKEQIFNKIIVLSSTEEVSGGVILGSYMPVTSTAGLMVADYIIKKIME